ncbi:uncharacterized protein BBA_02559 [Beauveria bassiana ARSEF 2860]|uniref:Uncharacterized protein n=1 Tax=Beauveria bassiana (strain ARSEF 2860) TaxID=655819 RepID=J4USC6_BEAB2|nr:uncharacterized protein BBA_02559 [Beauveria bassiana ARSEF 2860]EJP68557.1 hypothetical protein BBA_02559 [Beauveria bassiana ARSEF 2860]
MSVNDSRELVEAMLQQEFEGSGIEATTIVYKNAEEIIKTSKMGLWAQSAVQESVVINMRMPGIKRFLRNLAEMGVGVTAEYQGVLYKFVPKRRRPAPVCSVLRLDWPKWEWVVT